MIVRMCICTYVRMCICTYVRMCICTYVRMCICTYVCTYIHTEALMNVCTHTWYTTLMLILHWFTWQCDLSRLPIVATYYCCEPIEHFLHPLRCTHPPSLPLHSPRFNEEENEEVAEDWRVCVCVSSIERAASFEWLHFTGWHDSVATVTINT